MYYGAVRNICAIRHSCIIADRAVAADASKVSHSGTGANHTVGIDQGVVPYRGITVDFCSGVQQNTVANGRTILDTSVLQHHTATANFSKRTDIRTGRNDIGKSKAKGLAFSYTCARNQLLPMPTTSKPYSFRSSGRLAMQPTTGMPQISVPTACPSSTKAQSY